MKLLQERLKWCYFKEGVNHFENCREIASALMDKIKKPYHGMQGAPSTEW